MADVSSAAWWWSRSMRRTVAGEGCWPFFLPLVMTSRAAMSRRLRFLVLQVEGHTEHRVVGDGERNKLGEPS